MAFGAFVASQQVLPQMIERKKGTVRAHHFFNMDHL